MGWGHFTHHLTKSVEKVVHTAVSPLAKPITKALTPVVGKSAASIIGDPLGKVAQVAHPATVALGKVDATIIGAESGLVGAVALSHSSKTVGKVGAAVGTTLIPLEKVGVGVALSAIGAGALNGVVNAGLNAAIPPTPPPVGVGGGGGGGDVLPTIGADGKAMSTGVGAGSSSWLLPVAIALGAVLIFAGGK